MTTIAVLTSGGDAPGMNAAVRSVAKLCAQRGVRAVGVDNGYDGLIDGKFRDLCKDGRTAVELDMEGNHGGTILGSARCRRFFQPDGRARAAEQLRGIDGLIVIGGNGSLTGAHALAQEHGVRVMGVPASIDNDVGCTSMSIGVDTALNTIVEACDKIGDTARAHRRAFVLEVMGRKAGYLAMASGVAAGADGILFREQGRSNDELVSAVEALIRRGFAVPEKRRILVIKSEGVEMPCTRLVREVEARLTKDLPEVEVRATVLGHLVRGGNPTYQDRMLAGRLAAQALELLAQGHSDEMVAWLPQQVEGGTATSDPAVFRFSLSDVLTETQALLDGTSAVTRWRVKMLESVEAALAL